MEIVFSRNILKNQIRCLLVVCLFVSYLVSTTLQVSKRFSSGHLSSVRWSQSLDFFVSASD